MKKFNPNEAHIRAIFLDIDGTLVSFNTHKVPQSTLAAVHRLHQQGVKIIIATGRPLPFVDNLGELEYDGIMTVNGASCRTKAGEVIQHNPVDKEDIISLLHYQERYPFPVIFASDTETFITSLSDSTREVLSMLNIKCPQVAPINHALDMDVMQLVAFFSVKDEPYIMQQVMPHSDAHRWHPAFADVIGKGNSKAHGVDTFIRHFHISLDDTMAFGDGGNDICMLQHVKYGFVMGNAREEIRQQAPYQTSSVDEDGVAKILNLLYKI